MINLLNPQLLMVLLLLDSKILADNNYKQLLEQTTGKTNARIKELLQWHIDAVQNK